MAKIALFTLCYAAHVSAFPLAPREMTKPTTMHALSKKSTAEEVASMYAKDSLAGKVAVVTGGNSGIGLETCKVLAERGCKVVLCSRSREAGEAAIASLPPTQGSVVVAQLDLADLTRVDTAATEIETLLVDHKKIDFLVLNAGIMATPTLEYTPQGFEMQVGTNHFGHFRLTQKLWPFVAQAGCRVVVLSSTAHTFGSVEVDDLHYKKGRPYSPWGAYGQSKACNLMFAKELAERLAPSGGFSCSVHPGVIATNLWREEQGPSILNRLGSFSLNKLLPRLIADKSIEQGAATTLYGCLAPALPLSFNGAYLADCDVGTPDAKMADPELRKALWETTEAQINEVMK